jgi:hypothetical protein
LPRRGPSTDSYSSHSEWLRNRGPLTLRFHRRYTAWGKYGVSAFAAHDEAEIDAICETKLERFEEVVVIERSELERSGIEIVPTFRRPHVTLAHGDLDALVEGLQSCEHRRISNRHHQREGRQP